MLPKFVLILYYLVPFTVFGQAVITLNLQKIEYGPFGQVYYAANNLDYLGSLHFPATQNFAYDAYKDDPDFPVYAGHARQDEEWAHQYGEAFSWPLDQKEAFGQHVYSEPLSLISVIRHDENKMGVSAAGGVIYTGGDDVFAYAHYGRTGKLIWRTSPIANNMMATRWSLVNFNIFRKASLPSISDQLR
jgi:hypothetical protein